MDYDDLYLPWDRSQLEALARQLVERGEGPKVDLKAMLDLSGAAAHGELLKDISAMANTYDAAHRNYGFIIVGASSSAVTFAQFSQTTDQLQATIDDLVKKHIEPFVRSHVLLFGHDQEAWGVIVIPPTRQAPHVFVHDIHKRSRGDIYVRRGTTTDKAGPADYVRFLRSI